ncbi:MAG: hypothetical protein AB1585_11735 [Thermodesulfobacteriota bacterium]
MKKVWLTCFFMLLLANVSWAQHSHGTVPGKEGPSPGKAEPAPVNIAQMMSMCPMMKMMEHQMKMKDVTPQLLELVGILEKIFKTSSPEEKDKLLQELARIRQQLEKSAQEKVEGQHSSPPKTSEPLKKPSSTSDAHKQH